MKNYFLGIAAAIAMLLIGLELGEGYGEKHKPVEKRALNVGDVFAEYDAYSDGYKEVWLLQVKYIQDGNAYCSFKIIAITNLDNLCWSTVENYETNVACFTPIPQSKEQ